MVQTTTRNSLADNWERLVTLGKTSSTSVLKKPLTLTVLQTTHTVYDYAVWSRPQSMVDTNGWMANEVNQSQANLCRLGKSVKSKSLIPSARQPGMDFFVPCAFIITIILNPHRNSKPSKLCGNLHMSISTSSKSIVPTASLMKDCKVVLSLRAFLLLVML